MYFVVFELTLVIVAICKSEQPSPILQSSLILPLINLSIDPSLLPFAPLLVLPPLANVLCPISMLINPKSIRLVIEPLTIIGIAI